MGIFETIATGYKIMFEKGKLGWKRHGAQIMTGSGTTMMLVSGGLMAKKGLKAETQKAIEEANALVDQIKGTPIVIENGESKKKAKAKKAYSLAKAHGKRLATVGKHFWKESALAALGAGLVGAGQHMNTVQKTELAAGAALIAGEFAAYRANVVADQGAEKDLEYLTTKKLSGAKSVTLEDGTVVENATGSDEGEVTVNADETAFKFWFSPETCPGLYSDNLAMTIENLKWAENDLWMVGRMNGHLYLNDMRRKFAPLNKPHALDHALGGVFGKIFDSNIPNGCAKFELGGWRDDADFMEGRKVGTWIIFPCDKEPIINKINKKFTAIETGMRQ